MSIWQDDWLAEHQRAAIADALGSIHGIVGKVTKPVSLGEIAAQQRSECIAKDLIDGIHWAGTLAPAPG
jgi:hypothetical protein